MTGQIGQTGKTAVTNVTESSQMCSQTLAGQREHRVAGWTEGTEGGVLDRNRVLDRGQRVGQRGQRAVCWTEDGATPGALGRLQTAQIRAPCGPVTDEGPRRPARLSNDLRERASVHRPVTEDGPTADRGDHNQQTADEATDHRHKTLENVFIGTFSVPNIHFSLDFLVKTQPKRE